ncbi:MAG: DNA mismatch repair endonuclease MutL [Candidatus Dadabacteria bacterium]
MPDKILLLPDNIANQIAAGEVIQRPASAVKELLENAIDAGATEIKLIINDAGKALIQVIDNGSGMSETDARMSFERHATSKIQNIEDLFHIRTMGFRGEALASIAAVSQVELRTRRKDDDVGTLLEVENSLVKKQLPVAAPVGTSICMKNLFFNVPARRNFLKSNASEMRHILDEFIRVALAFPHIFFSVFSNGQQVFHFEAGNLKQRVLQVLGMNYNSKLVSVKEDTDYLNIYGFIGKPETAKKTRGDQYFFVNNRFIKSSYLNHAVMSAYHNMISGDSFPAYILFIDLDPTQVDVNVHPTKQEIKFEDEKIIYAFIHAAVKHALAQFSITPTLDFDLDASIQQLESVQKPFTEDKQFTTRSTSIFQAFTDANQAHKINPNNFRPWQPGEEGILPGEQTGNEGFESLGKYLEIPGEVPATVPQLDLDTVPGEISLSQLFNTYILLPKQESILLIHQQLAHERIIYERLAKALLGKPLATQSSLFPVTIELSPADAVLLNELLPDLQQLGYSIESFGKNSFIIQGTPADVEQGEEAIVLEKIVEQYKYSSTEFKVPKREMLLRTVALQQAIKAGTVMKEKEMQMIVEELFNCQQPNSSPSGRPVYMELTKQQLDAMFLK